ncbi:MAG: pilus assembly protein [Rhodoferax sp.]|nr:pilus assembly protein [Rhodoferax sp.]
MKNSPLAKIRYGVLQRGVAAVEFALVAIPFFLLLFGAMEFGRLFYLWNTAQEVTRHAARQAVVSSFDDASILAIQRAAVFRGNAGTLPAAPEISDQHVVIRYLNAAGTEVSPRPSTPKDNIAACLDSERLASCIRYVEVCLSTGTTCSPNESIPFQPMIGLFSKSAPEEGTDLSGIRIPLSTVRMPAESLGLNPVP